MSEERIIRGMVGRDLDSRYPERTPNIGEEVLRIEDWTVHHPTGAQPASWSTSANLHVRAGEVVGIAGLMGAGRTELAMSVFGRSYGHDISGNLYKDGQPRSASAPCEQAIEHGIAYATEDRKRYGLNLIDDIKRNISGSALGKLASRGWVDANREQVVANGYRKSMRIKAPNVGRDHRQAVRRQPAEGRAEQVDVLRPRRADPGRAHPGHRRRRQVRDLHDHQRAGRAGEGDHRHLLRAARAARHLRPHLRPVGRPDHR